MITLNQPFVVVAISLAMLVFISVFIIALSLLSQNIQSLSQPSVSE
jgi:hypothetical protein